MRVGRTTSAGASPPARPRVSLRNSACSIGANSRRQGPRRPLPEPTVIAGQAFTTGVIERKSFERVLPNTYVDYSMKDGLGCNIPSAAEKSGGKPVPDLHLNEHATCYHIKDRGLIVISSCGHTGIVNTTAARP